MILVCCMCGCICVRVSLCVLMECGRLRRGKESRGNGVDTWKRNENGGM